MPQQSLWLNAFITKLRESYSSVSMSHESKNEEVKQLVEFRQRTHTAFEGKMQLLRFSVLPGSAEGQVI